MPKPQPYSRSHSNYQKIGSLHVLSARGSATERMAAHLTALKHLYAESAFPALALKNELLIDHSPDIPWHQARQSLRWLYREILIPSFILRCTQLERRKLEIASNILQVPKSTVACAYYQADLMMLLSSSSLVKALMPDVQFAFPGTSLPGCTSAIVLGQHTRSGGLIHARNQDYPIVGPWERNPLLIFHEPTEEGRIPYVSISTALIHAEGITAMNRAGLTLAAHAHFGDRTSLFGRTVLAIAEAIMERATTLAEAIALIDGMRPIGSWAFVLSSASENRAIVVERSPDTCRVRESQDGILAHSNFYHHPELAEHEAFLSSGSTADLFGRYTRAEQLAREQKGTATPQSMAQILCDRTDPYTKTQRIIGNTINVVTTIKSVIFEPAAGALWMSDKGHSGCADEARFLRADWSWGEKLLANKPILFPEEFTTHPPHDGPSNDRFRSGFLEFRRAYQVWNSDLHPSLDRARATLNHLDQAKQTYPEDSNLHLLSGLVRFSVSDFSLAMENLIESTRHPMPNFSRAVALLFIARCHDIAAQRDLALANYQQALECTREPRCVAAIQQGLRSGYQARWAKTVMIDLQFADCFRY